MEIGISEIESGKVIYFASDFHLGAPNQSESNKRERKLVHWLEQISSSAQAIFLLGDVFDFWFEYKHVVPKGYVRFLGKLAELSDRGIKIIIFTGNHDLWLKDYLTQEIGAEVYTQPISVRIANKSFYLAHGDGLGPGKTKFKIIKKVYTNPICIWMFGWIHPTIGYSVAQMWSQHSKDVQAHIENDDTRLIIYSKAVEEKMHHDFYIYGDCHVDRMLELSDESIYVNLGDWVDKDSFGVFDGHQFSLQYFKAKEE